MQGLYFLFPSIDGPQGKIELQILSKIMKITNSNQCRDRKRALLLQSEGGSIQAVFQRKQRNSQFVFKESTYSLKNSYFYKQSL